jgi:predicted DNA-binding antitoxin AbrB/MazE fold protein
MSLVFVVSRGILRPECAAPFAPGMRRRDTGEAMELLNAIFEHGSFRPESHVELPEGTLVRLAVEIVVDGPQSPALSLEERRRIRQRVVERMMRNPLPPGAPRFNRSDMYDRD